MVATAGSALPNLSGLPREEKMPDGLHIGHHKMIVEHIKGHMRKIEASLDAHMAELERENVHIDATMTRAMTRKARDDMEEQVGPIEYDDDGYPKLETLKGFAESFAAGTLKFGIEYAVIAPLAVLVFTAIIAFFLLGFVVEGLRLLKQGRFYESHIGRHAPRFFKILREEVVKTIVEMKRDKIKLGGLLLAPWTLTMLLNQVVPQGESQIEMLQ